MDGLRSDSRTSSGGHGSDLGRVIEAKGPYSRIRSFFFKYRAPGAPTFALLCGHISRSIGGDGAAGALF